MKGRFLFFFGELSGCFYRFRKEAGKALSASGKGNVQAGKNLRVGFDKGWHILYNGNNGFQDVRSSDGRLLLYCRKTDKR